MPWLLVVSGPVTRHGWVVVYACGRGRTIGVDRCANSLFVAFGCISLFIMDLSNSPPSTVISPQPTNSTKIRVSTKNATAKKLLVNTKTSILYTLKGVQGLICRPGVQLGLPLLPLQT